jgi:Protein of unknown function (DUF4240)
MTLDEFWQHIEGAKNSCAKLEDVPNYLSHRLSQLPACDIVDFSRHFHDCVAGADDGCLWAAAIVIRGGCSDDSFDYFIGWLIAQGRKVFEAALVNPDSLADLESFDGDGATAQLESILSVDVDAYQMRIGSDDFEILRTRPRSGTRNRDFLRLSEEEMRELFPKLAAKVSRQRDGNEVGFA